MRISRYLIYLLSLLTLLVWLAVFSLPDNKLHLVACDVGEGDGLLITYQSSQILIDGGPNTKIIDCLSKYLPFWDRQIEAVILTHPDHDHMGGLSAVMSRYKVSYFVENQIDVSKPEYQVLEKLIGGGTKRVAKINPDTYLKVGMIHLDVFAQTSGETNDTSVVSLLKYGGFKALLTGDAPASVLEKLDLEPVNYLKVSHHGAKTGLTQALLEIIYPKVAVISVGKNSYGHPAPEIIKLLEDNKVEYFRTDLTGNIEIVSDGNGWWRGK